MKRTAIFLGILILTAGALAGTRHLGNYSYINTDGPLKVAVNAAVAAKFLNKTYLPLVVYMGTEQGTTARLERSSFTLIYKGKEIPMATFRELRENYNQDVQDLTLLANETEHIFPSEMSVYQFQHRTDFFPARTEPMVVTDVITLTYPIGARTKLYFKNPGIQKGDTATLRIRDNNHPEMTVDVDIRF